MKLFVSMRAVLCVAAALVAPSLFAQTATPKIDFVEYDLPNGLHVILHRDTSVPVISSYVLYHVGSKDEKPDRTGFAHFFEHLMFEGSEYIKRGQIDKLVSGAGGNLNASTSFDRTDYYINLPSNQLKLALWIESERMLHAKIDSVGVETQRQVVKEERRVRVDNQPYGTALEVISEETFSDTPYRWTPIGSFQYIDKATIEEFREFYKQYYVPNNATLCLAGDLDIEETKKLVEQYFGDIPRGADPPRPVVNFKPFTTPKSRVVEKQNTPLPATLHIWRTTSQTDKDAYALDMLSDILANGKSSRIYKRLVDVDQLAVQASVFPFMQEKAGMLGIFAVGNQGVDVQKIDKTIEDELNTLLKKGITDEEFQKVRNQKESQNASAFGSIASKARNLANYHVFNKNTNLINTELSEYMKVTKADIQRVAKKYLTKNGRVLIHYPVPQKPL
jgi:predicted Zn-dependent peptidase